MAQEINKVSDVGTTTTKKLKEKEHFYEEIPYLCESRLHLLLLDELKYTKICLWCPVTTK